jgi:acetylornithine/N-succinyldiaminopimelate aminotransferase
MPDVTDAEIRALDQAHVLPTYNRLPGLFVRGEGCRLFDSEGRSYLDFLAGIAVCQLGHSHPAVVQAICQQAAKLMHTSNHLLTEPQARLAERLCQISGMERAFFAGCGATANETALKIAKKHGRQKRPSGDYQIVTLLGGFHGRTLGAVSATPKPKYQDPFRPLLPNFVHIPPNDIDALKQTIGSQTAAVLAEPIQGEGGVLPLTREFFQACRELTQRHDALLIVDEVQTGIGRTGKWFAYQHEDIQPDLVCVAKGLGGGMPIGACLASGQAASALDVGEHGSTFGGNALACATALAVLETIVEEGLLVRAAEVGEHLREALERLPQVRQVRGRGLMLGAVLDQPIARETVRQALDLGLVTNATDEHTLRIVPPLILTAAEADEGVELLAAAIERVSV